MTRLFYSDAGKGRPIVLLHGFLETHIIWKEFSKNLEKHYRVLAFDLPGFGQSTLPEKTPFELSEIADQINEVLLKLAIKDVFLIGHSLGGYISLAMVASKPEIFAGFCLFHSTALADTEQKKEARTKTIEFVIKNGAHAFTSNFVPPLFADPNHTAVGEVKLIASSTAQETVIHYLGAMRDRPERTSVIKNFPKPILFIAGEKDSIIPLNTLLEQLKFGKNAAINVLANVGHMGMVESPVECHRIIRDFLSHIKW